MKRRFEELDSLRGLAAMSVLLSHFLLVFPSIINPTFEKGFEYKLNVLKYSPLHIFYAGHESVIFFFILSGFVLSLMLFDFKKENYGTYVFKRFLRIYPPYIIAVFVALLAKVGIDRQGLPGLSDWIQGLWGTPTSFQTVLSHILMLGDFKVNSIDPVLWSMVHEMRISIVFPLLVFIIVKWGFKNTAVLTLFLSLIGYVLMKVTGNDPVSSNYFITFHYLSFFMVGGLLARYRSNIIGFVEGKSTFFKVLALVAGCVVYMYKWYFMNIGIIHVFIFDEWFTAIGASLFIVISLSSKRLSTILKVSPIAFLGKISYSLYLYHMIALLVCLHLFYNKINIWSTLTLSLIASVLLATIAYYLVEKPSIQLSKSFAKRRKSKILKNKIA